MSEGKKEILLGDCLELMKDIPNGSIDMILCDLPYGTTACKWDIIIPFDKLWEQYKRIIKPNGAVVLFGSEPFSSYLRLSNINEFQYDWIWIKNRPANINSGNSKPMKYHENISVFYKNKCIYNKQMIPRSEGGKYIYKSGQKNNTKISSTFGELNGINNKNKKTYSFNDYDSELKNPSSCLYFNKVKNTLHQTQKPVALFEYLINTYTNENALVLDNTAGSGTTAIACLNTNRQFIVMEKEQKYYDIILKRVGDFNKKFETQTLFGNEM
jgi:site-specific DNA-methyltransferase (adenine-specific)